MVEHRRRTILPRNKRTGDVVEPRIGVRPRALPALPAQSRGLLEEHRPTRLANESVPRKVNNLRAFLHHQRAAVRKKMVPAGRLCRHAERCACSHHKACRICKRHLPQGERSASSHLNPSCERTRRMRHRRA